MFFLSVIQKTCLFLSSLFSFCLFFSLFSLSFSDLCYVYIFTPFPHPLLYIYVFPQLLLSFFLPRFLFHVIYLSTLLFRCFFLICIFLAMHFFVFLSHISFSFSPSLCIYLLQYSTVSPHLTAFHYSCFLFHPSYALFLSYPIPFFFISFCFCLPIFHFSFPSPLFPIQLFFFKFLPPFSYLLPVLTRLEQQFVKPVVRMSNYSPSALTLQTFTKTNKIVSLNYKLTAISAGFGKSDSSFGRVRNLTRARHFKGVISMYTVQNIWRNRLRYNTKRRMRLNLTIEV